MCVQSVCYTNAIGLLHKCERILILCLMIQCLIISENKVYGDGNTTRTVQQNQQPETPSNHTLSGTIQETVQPARKIISAGAFVRAFYVFVGLGAIIVMYIVVRTVR
jgi:hypothetical protein